MCSKTIQGFKAVTIRLPDADTHPHEIFLKEHSLRHYEDDKPPGRTLFVLNIPSYFENKHVQSLFSATAPVTKVIMPSSPGFKSAHVVFAKPEGLSKVLALDEIRMSQSGVTFETGLSKWVEEYNNSIRNPDELANELNTFMLRYDKSQAKSSKQEKKLSQEVDDEGWTVVTKKGHKPGIANKESVKIKLAGKIVEKKRKKELKNFYTFQIKEGKMKNLTLLRKNFEDAKKRVEAMKSSRKFRPY
ncbi:ribosomal RNA-processing protein 7 homolog A [Dendroctonus ponderosae]|uniref:Ribosomal RNA-processing protein 7 C-terminal domain-containing protein n=1 Tax=Dendroctonus ponderosae TaxID=77166 RepID=U4US90_DENPD|nr:ribosomal RNA-processing protein 7 homolog A [Dendroctonus ponderosae]ERL93041.1 hypothetical protein D910_10343 [Dendroctonus ponderosae]KAH1018583.1 hypothetical protein HUJ05_006325 [Dendroctonus ponderosae]KAH1018584.1 hypothetical protein HUJ05_006325 [Dendroctonus ponderosae]KAH1018585.1 hypothetical protein HUJ05_006325 [Dendroctonus ponderosae]